MTKLKATKRLPWRLPDWKRMRWLQIVAGFAGLFVVCALLAPLFINADRYRASLSGAMTEQTGRKVTLGKIRARVLPRPGFSIEGFRMGNPQGFSAEDFLTSSRVRGAVAFWPLVLRREVRITSLVLTRTKLVLLEDPRGQNNYTFASTSTEKASEIDTLNAKIGTGGSSLLLEEVSLREAEVVYGGIDSRGAVTLVVDASGFNVDLRHVALQPMRIREWQVDAKLNGSSFALAGWNEPITFQSGTITVRNAVLDSSFSVDFGKAARITGSFAIPDVEHAMVNFDLKTDDIDLDAVVSAMTAKSPGKPAGGSPNRQEVSTGQPGELSRPQGGTPASELVAQGHLAAERIRSGPHLAGPATADLRLYTDRMEIWPVTVRVYDGSVQASARTDRRQEPQRFSINIQARNLNIGEMIVTSPMMRGKLAGTGELDLQVFGSLDETLQKSLTGKGQLAIRNGRISGFSLTSAAGMLANMAGVSGDTPFTAITADIDVANERVASRNVQLASSLGTAEMRGSFGFDGALDYQGHISAAGATDAAQSAAAQTNLPSNTRPNSGSVPGAARENVPPRNGKLNVPFTLNGTVERPEFLPGRAVPKFAGHSDKSGRSGNRNERKRGSSFPNLFQK